METTPVHFRIDTTAFFKELADCALTQGNNGIFKRPLNIFMNLLAQVATRATQLHDPVLDKIMFDLALYELPTPTTPEYTALMKQVYEAADKQRAKELKKTNKKTTKP